MMNYVHMGYMSNYERELVIEIEEGRVLSAIEYENESTKMPKNFSVVQATAYSFYAPSDLINSDENFWYSFTDTLNVYNADSSKFFSTLSAFHGKRMNRDDRLIFVKSMVEDFVVENQHKGIEFDDINSVKTRWGSCGWVDGKDQGYNIRFFVITNINGYMKMAYIENGDPYQFRYNAETMCESVRLMEFSY